jgi:ADP-heptose:LPS heptosyltransferase
MKILILSLMRLGDILMAAPTIRALRVQFPQAEIHVWIQRGFEHVSAVMNDVDVWHLLDRKTILDSFQTDASHSFFAYDILSEQIKVLNSMSFDRVYNLTNTRLSAILAGTINAPEHIGAYRNARGVFALSGNAFRNFNMDSHSQMHFIDLLWQGSGYSGATRIPDDLFGSHLESPLLNNDRFLVQLTTSDQKKSWSFDRWKQTLAGILQLKSQAEFTVIGAEFERGTIEPVVQNWIAEGIPVKFQSATLSEVATLIRQHQYFITLDTATKHLALGSRAQVVEIALGSSRPPETGIYLADALIIQGHAACVPCAHRNPCSRTSHVCGESVLASQVVNAIRGGHHAFALRVAIDPEIGFQIAETHRPFTNKPKMNLKEKFQ